jgi:serine/threonine protein kinase
MTLTKTKIFGFPSVTGEGAALEASTLSDPDGARAPVAPGDLVGGAYEVERVIASGGMGIVVAARHAERGQRVAIKFLREDLASDADIVTRFEREARAAIEIESEHAMKVFAVGALASGTPYMVMEFLEGEDLATWLRTRGALRLEQAVEFMLQACEAMSKAHALGLVHRDLKPANLFVARAAEGSTTVKVLDFGISKALSERALTRKNVTLGSPCYMSPEQLTRAVEIDARADVWALGVTLFELLTGTVPFDGETMPAICSKILRDPPPPVRDLRPNAPEGLERVIAKCLEKERERRFASVRDFSAALAPFRTGARGAASARRVTRALDAEESERLQATRVVDDRDSKAFLRKRRVRPGFVVFGVLGLSSFVLLLAWRSSGLRAAQADPPRATDPAPSLVASPSEVPPPPADVEPHEPTIAPPPPQLPPRSPSVPATVRSTQRSGPKRAAAAPAATPASPISPAPPKPADVFEGRN